MRAQRQLSFYEINLLITHIWPHARANQVWTSRDFQLHLLQALNIHYRYSRSCLDECVQADSLICFWLGVRTIRPWVKRPLFQIHSTRDNFKTKQNVFHSTSFSWYKSAASCLSSWNRCTQENIDLPAESTRCFSACRNGALEKCNFADTVSPALDFNHRLAINHHFFSSALLAAQKYKTAKAQHVIIYPPLLVFHDDIPARRRTALRGSWFIF